MKTLLTIVTVLLTASFAVAGPLVTVTPLGAPTAAKEYEGSESFETAWPPLGWERSVSNPDATWSLWPNGGYDGSQCAMVPMDIMGAPQDEWLGFTTSYTEDQVLNFALKGSGSVSSTLFVWVGEDLVFDFATDWTLPQDQWGLVTVDLSQTNYAGYPNVHFAWQRVGTFGMDIFLDMVSIDEGSVTSEGVTWSRVKTFFE